MELASAPTEDTPPLPEYQTGFQALEPVFSASSNVSLIRSSISSLRPNATAQTVSRSGVVIHGSFDFVCSTASPTVCARFSSHRSVLR